MDPRNVAHDKTVAQEKKHKGEAAAPGAPHDQPGKKERKKKQKPAAAGADAAENSAPPANEAVPVPPAPKEPPPELEGSLVILAQLKDLAFHANAHQGRLAEMMLTMEDKLKQKELAATVSDIYSAQAALHDKLTDLVIQYGAECDRLKVG